MNRHQRADDNEKVNKGEHRVKDEEWKKKKHWAGGSSGVSFLKHLHPANGVGLPEVAIRRRGKTISDLTEAHNEEFKKGKDLNRDKCSYRIYTVVHIGSKQFMKKEMTKREKKVFEWIKDSQRDHGGYPTYREIQAALGFSSINSVSQYVKQLAEKGYLELIKNRGYRLPQQERPALVDLPFLGSVQAGLTNDTQETAEVMSIPGSMVASPQRSFLLRVRGNSMSDAGIHEDDIVIVDAQRKANVGDVIVALVGDQTTVKRLSKIKNRLYLKAESPDHEDIYPNEEWEIQGVVTGLWREY